MGRVFALLATFPIGKTLLLKREISRKAADDDALADQTACDLENTVAEVDGCMEACKRSFQELLNILKGDDVSKAFVFSALPKDCNSMVFRSWLEEQHADTKSTLARIQSFSNLLNKLQDC